MATLICSVLSYLLFISVGPARGFGGQDGCSSSCGELRDIRYPFRLKTDRANCGDPNYELECHGNNTFLEILPGKYLVTSIFYENSTIQIVDVGFLNGSCNLPIRSLSVSFIYDSYRYLNGQNWAVFVNCSNDIGDYARRHVPCLSQNNRFVYVTDGYFVDDLLPSCSYLTMVPIVANASNFGVDFLAANITTLDEDHVFQDLRNGFVLSWSLSKPTRSMIIKGCLREAPRDGEDYMEGEKKWKWLIYPFQLEYEFVDCIKKTRDYALYRLSLVLIVFIDVATLLLVIAALGRFIIAPLCIYVFLTYELWKIFAPIDPVEKFLRHQHVGINVNYRACGN